MKYEVCAVCNKLYIRKCYIAVELVVCLWWSASLSCYQVVARLLSL